MFVCVSVCSRRSCVAPLFLFDDAKLLQKPQHNGTIRFFRRTIPEQAGDKTQTEKCPNTQLADAQQNKEQKPPYKKKHTKKRKKLFFGKTNPAFSFFAFFRYI